MKSIFYKNKKSAKESDKLTFGNNKFVELEICWSKKINNPSTLILLDYPAAK